MAILTPSLVKLRSGFNLIAPDRDKASDGWIGNLAHQGSSSGHNPDETGNAERRDADNLDEVRAIDVDKDLRRQGLTMQQCVQKTLATPNDRKRLIYIIWNRTIWTKSSGWVARAYTGASPHTEHAHFSGDPAYDNDTSPWGIEELIDVSLTKEEHTWLETVHRNLTVLDGRNPIGQIYTRMSGGEDHTGAKIPAAYPTLKSLSGQLAAMQTALTALAGKDFADERAIVAGVLAGLTPEAIAAAIPPTVAKQVADELARRMAGAQPAS